MPGPSVSSVQSVCTLTESSLHIKVKDHYRLVVMGAAGVGKTAITHQFLYDEFPLDHRPTVEEMHRGDLDVAGLNVTLEILDTSGSFEFPAMRRLAISQGDAFVLVYSINDAESFEEVRRLRDSVLDARPNGVPLVVVGNKVDLEDCHRVVRKEIAETIVCIDWEAGFVESSAKTNLRVLEIFRQLLVQSNLPPDLSLAVNKRRTSLPCYPTSPKDSLLLKRNSCAVS